MSKAAAVKEVESAEEEDAMSSATTFAALLFLAEKFPHRQFNASELSLLSGIGRTAMTQIKNSGRYPIFSREMHAAPPRWMAAPSPWLQAILGTQM